MYLYMLFLKYKKKFDYGKTIYDCARHCHRCGKALKRENNGTLCNAQSYIIVILENNEIRCGKFSFSEITFGIFICVFMSLLFLEKNGWVAYIFRAATC